MSEPFYWNSQSEGIPPAGYEYPNRSHVARSGWYQWQKRGLVYLGESILSEENFAKIEVELGERRATTK